MTTSHHTQPPAYIAEAIAEYWRQDGISEHTIDAYDTEMAAVVWAALLEHSRIDYRRKYGETITSSPVLVVPLANPNTPEDA